MRYGASLAIAKRAEQKRKARRKFAARFEESQRAIA
jgi:hypothetical protein